MSKEIPQHVIDFALQNKNCLKMLWQKQHFEKEIRCLHPEIKSFVNFCRAQKTTKQYIVRNSLFLHRLSNEVKFISSFPDQIKLLYIDLLEKSFYERYNLVSVIEKSLQNYPNYTDKRIISAQVALSLPFSNGNNSNINRVGVQNLYEDINILKYTLEIEDFVKNYKNHIDEYSPYNDEFNTVNIKNITYSQSCWWKHLSPNHWSPTNDLLLNIQKLQEILRKNFFLHSFYQLNFLQSAFVRLRMILELMGYIDFYRFVSYNKNDTFTIRNISLKDHHIETILGDDQYTSVTTPLGKVQKTFSMQNNSIFTLENGHRIFIL